MEDMGPAAKHRSDPFSPAVMAIAAVILTALALYAIKFFIGGGGQEEYSRQAAQDVFKQQEQEQGEGQAGPKPELRSASSMMGGDSIGMFAKTNSGYAGEEEAVAEPVAAQKKADMDPAGAAAAAIAKATPAGTQGPAATGTAIPRLKPVKGFGSASQSQGGTGGVAGGGGAVPSNLSIDDIVKQTTNNALSETSKKGRKRP